jgi:hypothetical protein
MPIKGSRLIELEDALFREFKTRNVNMQAAAGAISLQKYFAAEVAERVKNKRRLSIAVGGRGCHERN